MTHIWVTCFHLSGLCILQTRVKIAILGVLSELTDLQGSNLVKIPNFIIYFEIWPKNAILTIHCVFCRPVCKIQILDFCISRTRGAFDLKFSPVIGIDNIRLCEKFQFGHLFDWYFTDRSVNSFCLVARVPFWVM